MIKLSKETISLFTDNEIQAQYIQSRMIELKSMIRKTCKRTGLTIAQVSEIVSWKKSKTYLTHLTSYKRFREKGDLHLSDLDNLAKKWLQSQLNNSIILLLTTRGIEMKVKMYKAVDARDNHESLFAVRGNEMAFSTYFGKDDSWLSEDGFGDFNSYCIEDHDESRMINPVLVWEN